MGFANDIYRQLTAGCWQLGFIEEPLEEIILGMPYAVHYLSHPYNDRWFADPWLLATDSKEIILLVEEYTYKERLGYISKLIVDRNTYKLKCRKPILKLSTHLSFPAILYEHNKTFIYPENAAGEGLGLYEIKEGHDELEYIKNISKLPLADAVITNVFGEKFLFGTLIPKHNGNELSVYRIDDDYCIEPYTKCSFGSNVARNAGNWFRLGEKIYRPAQDCNTGYGTAVIIQEVERNGNQFVFHDIKKIVSYNPRYNIGLHTFNHLNGLSVIDVHGYHYGKFVAETTNALFDMYVRLFK